MPRKPEPTSVPCLNRSGGNIIFALTFVLAWLSVIASFNRSVSCSRSVPNAHPLLTPTYLSTPGYASCPSTNPLLAHHRNAEAEGSTPCPSLPFIVFSEAACPPQRECETGSTASISKLRLAIRRSLLPSRHLEPDHHHHQQQQQQRQQRQYRHR